MSSRKPAVLRGGAENVHDHLIATAARLIGAHGSAGLGVRDIAREAQVADGVLYNYFDDKEDLLAQALLAHVAMVMNHMPAMPEAGTGTVAGQLAAFIENGTRALAHVGPAFAGLRSQPKVLARFQAMVGGDAAFGTAAPGPDSGSGTGAEPPAPEPAGPAPSGPEVPGHAAPGPGAEDPGGPAGVPRGLPGQLRAYLTAEQRLGRIDSAADTEAAVMLVIGAIHGQVLPHLMMSAPGDDPGELGVLPAGMARRIADTVLRGIG